MKKSELLKEYNKMRAKLLKVEREESKPFRIFSPTDDWIYIIEWEWKNIELIKRYKFKWYDIYSNAVFSVEECFSVWKEDL